MYSSSFEWVAAESFEDAVRLLGAHGEEAKIVAGGQSLVPMMHLRLVRPEVLVDVNGVGPPERLETSERGLHLGAVTRQRVLERSEEVLRDWPLLAEAVGHIGNVRVRARGTVGGNLAHADPTSEIACAAVALGADVEVLGPDGSRRFPVHDLFVSHLTTSLAPAEIITAIDVPRPSVGAGQAFLELARRAGEFAVVNAAAIVGVEPGSGTIEQVRLACGGVDERVRDFSAVAGEILLGSPPSEAAFLEVGRLVASGCRPYDDAQASAGYRHEMARVFVGRALRLAARRAQAGEER